MTFMIKYVIFLVPCVRFFARSLLLYLYLTLPVQNESLCEMIHMKMCSAYRFILTQLKFSYERFLHQDSF